MFNTVGAKTLNNKFVEVTARLGAYYCKDRIIWLYWLRPQQANRYLLKIERDVASSGLYTVNVYCTYTNDYAVDAHVRAKNSTSS